MTVGDHKMTVGELIEMLQQFDPSLLVILVDSEQGYEDMYDARLMIQNPNPFLTHHIYEIDYTPEQCGLANKEWESLKCNTKTHRVLLFAKDWCE